jgi:hypothetical protein
MRQEERSDTPPVMSYCGASRCHPMVAARILVDQRHREVLGSHRRPFRELRADREQELGHWRCRPIVVRGSVEFHAAPRDDAAHREGVEGDGANGVEQPLLLLRREKVVTIAQARRQIRFEKPHG